MKNSTIFLQLVICLTVGLLVFSSVYAALIFSEGFESGNLNAWSVTYGTLSINNQVVNTGNYSVQNNVIGSAENLYYRALSSVPNPIFLREYVYINSTTVPSTNGDYYEVGGFSTSAGGNFGDGGIYVFNAGGTLYWGIFYRDLSAPNGFSHVISTSNTTSSAHAVSIGWNCVELRHFTGTTGNKNGQEQLFLNGELLVDVYTYNSDRTPANVVLGGSQHVVNSNDRWNYYVDDVVVADSYIGPILYLLTTSANYGAVTPTSGPYAEASTVTIAATSPAAASGERFVWLGWIGSGIGSYTGTNNPATVTMGSAITQQAIWEHDYYLTVSSTNGTASGTGWYNASTTAYASVTPTTVAGTTGTQYVFIGWSGDASGGSSPSNPITMNASKTAVANWKTQYYLNVSSVNGTVGGSDWYDSGANATATLGSLTVAGATGTQYVFIGWSGDASGNASPSNNISMTGPKTAVANWQTQYNLTLAQSGVGSDFSGNLIVVNGTGYGIAGFTVWANSSDVYTFGYAPQLVIASSSKQCLLTAVGGNSSALSVAVSQPTTIAGAYKTQYYLTSTSAYGSSSPADGWYDSGSSLSAFVASPVSGGSGTQYVCSGWSGTGSVAASGGSSAMTFTIGAPSTISWSWKTQYMVSFAVSPSGGGSTSPSGTNSWQDAGSISISGTPSYNYKFSSWATDTGSITFGNSNSGSTSASVYGPGTITAIFAELPKATPTPTIKPTPTASASAPPSPVLSASPSPTASPTSSASQPPSGAFNVGTVAVIGVVVALILVGAAAGFMVLRKRRKPRLLK